MADAAVAPRAGCAHPAPSTPSHPACEPPRRPRPRASRCAQAGGEGGYTRAYLVFCRVAWPDAGHDRVLFRDMTAELVAKRVTNILAPQVLVIVMPPAV